MISNNRYQYVETVRTTVRTETVKTIKRYPNYRRIPGYDIPNEMCLCGVCASAFYNLPDHIIRRVDKKQKYKDRCNLCGVRTGFDYLIYAREDAYDN